MELTHPLLIEQGFVPLDIHNPACTKALDEYAGCGHKEIALPTIVDRLAETYIDAADVFAMSGQPELLQDDDDTYVDEWLEDSDLPEGHMATHYPDIKSGGICFELCGIFAFHPEHGVVLEVREVQTKVTK